MIIIIRYARIFYLRFFEEKKKKKSSFISQIFSQILQNESLLRPPIFETQRQGSWLDRVSLSILSFVSINHSAAELSKNGQVLVHPLSRLVHPWPQLLLRFFFSSSLSHRFFASFLPLSFQHPFLRCLAHFFVSRNFLNAFLRSFVTASLFFFL